MNRGETFGKYEILEEIGVGGFATVYKAKDTMLDREVALKVLRRELSSDPAFVQSFEAEAWRAAELEHPNIVRIYEVGRFEDTPYLAMEYVDGQSLAEVIQGFGRLTVPQALKIVRGVAAGLDAAHSRGLVHRGVKPSNILIGRDGRVLLTDFGLARAVSESVAASLASAERVMDRLTYMSPEEAAQRSLDPRADVYALGVVLYEMLAGRPPFEGETALELIEAHVGEPPPPPTRFNEGVSRGVESVVMRALAKGPEWRYQTAGEMAEALEEAVRREAAGEVQAVPQASVEPARVVEPVQRGVVARPRRRWRWVAIAAGILAVVAIAVGLVGFFGEDIGLLARATPTERPTREREREATEPLEPEMVTVVVETVVPISTRVPEPTEGPVAEPTMAPEPEPTEAPVAEPTLAPEPEPTKVVEPEPTPALGKRTYLDRAYVGEFEGTVVTVFGSVTDAGAAQFDEAVEAFEQETGIDVQYEGSRDFETIMQVRVAAGDPPDIADFSWLEPLVGFAEQGAVVDLGSFLDEDYLQGQYPKSWLDLATLPGPDGPIMAGAWHRFVTKSLVWYPKEAFEAAGYEVPATWDELIALSDQIVADGDSPWCVGIESGTATGWLATDWLEDIMLRTTSLENYDRWIRGDLAFSSPEVKNALTILSELWSDEYVYGGRESIVTTSFIDAPNPMFEDPPGCWLHKQMPFITALFPAGSQYGTDYGVFYLPPIEDAYGRPHLVVGDIMAMFNDRDEVRAVMEFFTRGESVRPWLAAGGTFSPHRDAELPWYGDDLERDIVTFLAEATSVHYDASELMPPEVGADAFWQGMADYFGGTADMDTVLEEIDDAWPR